MKARDNFWILVLGILISIASWVSLFLKWGLWYFPATIGILFIFDYFSSMKNKNTTLQIFNKDKKKFIKLYFLFFLLGATIECIGKFMFNLWNYPFQTNSIMDFIGLLFYPVILLSFREMYESLSLIIKRKFLLTLFSMLLGIIIWEISNLVIYSWIYTIPYIGLEIFKINIIVIIGGVILIGFPVWIYNEFFEVKK